MSQPDLKSASMFRHQCLNVCTTLQTLMPDLSTSGHIPPPPPTPQGPPNVRDSNLLVHNATEPLGEAREDQLGGLRGLQAGAGIIWGGDPRVGADRGAAPGCLGLRLKAYSTVSSEGGKRDWHHESLLGKGRKQPCRCNTR